jgi:hypothetical protein
MNCIVSCHGLDGEGQPDWRTPNADGLYPAPPHTGEGHTWHHADQQLLEIIAKGGMMPNMEKPGFSDQLGQDDMKVVLAHIKTFWTDEERDFQAEVSQR